MNYVLIGTIIFIFLCICCCISSSILGGYFWYTKQEEITIEPKPVITLASDPNLLYNYRIATGTKILMSGKVSSESFINNMNNIFITNNIPNIVATIVPATDTATATATVPVIEHYKIIYYNTTYYLTTDSKDMLYILMLILPDYTPIVNTVISTGELSPIIITPGMKSVSLAKLKLIQ